MDLKTSLKEIRQPGQRVVVIEDLISTGGSSLKAVEALRRFGCEVSGMLAVFTYGFPVAMENFSKADCSADHAQQLRSTA